MKKFAACFYVYLKYENSVVLLSNIKIGTCKAHRYAYCVYTYIYIYIDI